MSYKSHFQRFFAAAPGRLHVAAHSHHLWPDVTYEAQARCWDDAARLADRKWEHVFGAVYPAAQAHVARLLNLRDPRSVVFGPNTHSFVVRLLSGLPRDRAFSVLTSDSEFHSLARQLRRLEEDGLAQVTRVAAEPFDSFADRFAARAAQDRHDLVYVSHVFYNAGYVVSDLASIVEAVRAPETLVVIDGYHGFMALPTDLGPVQDRAFYLAGGYKYAMAGEGVAFMHAPAGVMPRPRDTGWFADFAALESAEGKGVAYAADGARFLGATFDPTGLYRFNAVMQWLLDLGLDVAAIHGHVHDLQNRFVTTLDARGSVLLNPSQLVVPVDCADRGNFLTFRTAAAKLLHDRLLDAAVITDYRGDRLRFGFGIYHDATDVELLCRSLLPLLADLKE